jgi:hypothetical protein
MRELSTLPSVTGWVLWKQKLRWSFGINMVIRDQHLRREGEEAGLGRERN